MKSADEVLQMLLQNSKSPLSNQFLRWQVWKEWKNLVGAQIASKSEPVGYQRRTLYIWVESSAWMQQLNFFATQIKNKVNQHVGREWVTSIRFTLDRKSVPSSEESARDLKESLSKTLPNEGAALKPDRSYRKGR